MPLTHFPNDGLTLRGLDLSPGVCFVTHHRARPNGGVQTENYDHKLRHYYVTTAPEAECDIRASPEYLHPSMVMSK